MMGTKIYFYGEICLIIPKLSLLPLLIWSTGSNGIPQFVFKVRHEAELAISMMEDKTVDSFEMLFMKKIPFTHTFDHIFQ